MTQREFVGVLKSEVSESAATNTVARLERPNGRTIDENLKTLSLWYNGLSTKDQAFVKNIAELSARDAVFGFLCVLDGVRAIENGVKGDLSLSYQKPGESPVKLNSPEDEMLHDLFNER